MPKELLRGSSGAAPLPKGLLREFSGLHPNALEFNTVIYSTVDLFLSGFLVRRLWWKPTANKEP